MSETDVQMMCLLTHACALACRVCQLIATREIMLLPAVGDAVVLADVVAARSWLWRYATCGMCGRRCFHDDRLVCGIPGSKGRGA
jgi:hypothetical protein